MRTRVVAVVPARAGSMRCPGKNVRPFGSDGRSLVEIACAQAAAHPQIGRVVLSTDYPYSTRAIEAVIDARHAVVAPRPERLARGSAPIERVIAHMDARGELGEWDVLLLLNPTSPWRPPAIIASAIELAAEHGAAVLVRRDTVTGWRTETGERLDHVPILRETGGLYAVSRRAWIASASITPPGAATIETDDPRARIDIDTPADWDAGVVLWRQGERA